MGDLFQTFLFWLMRIQIIDSIVNQDEQWWIEPGSAEELIHYVEKLKKQSLVISRENLAYLLKKIKLNEDQKRKVLSSELQEKKAEVRALSEKVTKIGQDSSINENLTKHFSKMSEIIQSLGTGIHSQMGQLKNRLMKQEKDVETKRQLEQIKSQLKTISANFTNQSKRQEDAISKQEKGSKQIKSLIESLKQSTLEEDKKSKLSEDDRLSKIESMMSQMIESSNTESRKDKHQIDALKVKLMELKQQIGELQRAIIAEQGRNKDLQEQISQKEQSSKSELQKIQTEKEQLTKKMADLTKDKEEVIKVLEDHINALKNQLKLSETTISQLQGQLQITKEKNAKNKEEIQLMEQRNQKMCAQIKEKEKETDRLNKLLADGQKLKKTLEKQYASELEAANQKIAKLEADGQNLRANLEKKHEDELKAISQKMNAMKMDEQNVRKALEKHHEDEINAIKEKMDKMQKEYQSIIETLKVQIKQKQQALNLESSMRSNLKSQSEIMNNKLQEALAQIQSMENTARRERTQAKNTEQKLNKLIEDYIKQIDELKQQNRVLVGQNRALLEQIRVFENQNRTLSQQNRVLQAIPIPVIERNFDVYFQNQVLTGFPNYKRQMIEHLQHEYKKPVTRTKMIYRWDPLNIVNFHKYFDQIPNLAVIVRLKDNRFIAAFTDSCFKRQANYYGHQSFIYSLHNNTVFGLKEGKRAITYDDFYLIVGNSEFRVRHGEQKIFSNFGIASSYINNNGKTVDHLFGEGRNNDVIFDYYEIYQILFEGEEEMAHKQSSSILQTSSVSASSIL